MAKATESAADKKLGKAGMESVSKISQMKDLGWRVDGSGKEWFAYEQKGDRKIGPASSVNALFTQVNLAAGNAPKGKKAADFDQDEETIDLSTSTSTRLPGMEEPDIEELSAQADECIAANERYKAAKAELDDHYDLMLQKMRDNGRKRYSRRGWSLVDHESSKLVLKKDAGPNPKKKKKEKSEKPVI